MGIFDDINEESNVLMDKAKCPKCDILLYRRSNNNKTRNVLFECSRCGFQVTTNTKLNDRTAVLLAYVLILGLSVLLLAFSVAFN